MKKLKILLITNIISPYRIPLFNHLQDNGDYSFTVFVLAERQENREWRLAKEQIKFDYKILPGFHKFIWSKEIAIHINWGLWKAILKYKPDIIITSGYDMLAYWGAFLYCKVFKKKFILWNGTTLLSTGRINGFIGQMKQFIIGGTNRYITYGTKAAEYLMHMGAPKECIHVGINTVDMNWFRKKTREYYQDENFQKERSRYPELLMLYVGQLISRKGVSQVLKALSKLHDPKIGLLIVGNGPQEKMLKQLYQDEELENIYFEGFRQQEALFRYYALADVLIFPSFKEVWGLVVNEALACGLYVLCSDRAGSAFDLIKKSCNGILFNPHNVKEFAMLIQQIKEQIREIRFRREAISESACREFSIERSGKAFFDAIEKIQHRDI